MIKLLPTLKKKAILSLGLGLLTAGASNAQIFEDSFESYTDFTITDFGGWRLLDNDGSATWGIGGGVDYPNESAPMAAIIFNPSAVTSGTISGVWNPRTGNKGLYFFSTNGGPSDDYAITPEISLTNVSSPSLSLWAKSRDGGFLDTFELLVSTTDVEIASFTDNISGDITPPNEVGGDNTVYTNYTFDLSAYEGENIYIAIHYKSNDKYVLQIDDFSVTGNVLSTEDFSAENFSHFYDANSKQLRINTASPMENVRIFDISGREVLNQSLSSNTGAIDLTSISNGTYITQVTINGATDSFMIVK